MKDSIHNQPEAKSIDSSNLANKEVKEKFTKLLADFKSLPDSTNYVPPKVEAEMKIWALFSIANEYYQPPANLEAWWENKPTLFQLAKALNIEVDIKKGSSTISNILAGNVVRHWDTIYRLEHIEEGIYVETT